MSMNPRDLKLLSGARQPTYEVDGARKRGGDMRHHFKHEELAGALARLVPGPKPAKS